MRLVGAHVVALAALHRAMARQFDRPARMLGPGGAVFEKARSSSAGACRDRCRRPCGPPSASATARWIDSVDLPAPPFSLPTTMTCALRRSGILVIEIHVANRRSQTHGIIGAMPPPWQTPSLRRAGRRGFPALFCAHAGSAWPMMRDNRRKFVARRALQRVDLGMDRLDRRIVGRRGSGKRRKTPAPAVRRRT